MYNITNMNKHISILSSIALAFMLASCSYIHDSLEPCPSGLYLTFEYDYNLQRADMFADHVGSVTAYVFDRDGAFLLSQTESGEQLAEDGYEMQLDLEPGRYQYVVLAGQKPFDVMAGEEGAKFCIDEPTLGEDRSELSITLDHDANGFVLNAGQPLDTLWHGMSLQPVDVVLDQITRDTVSLTRNTKQIHVALHDLDHPAAVDADHFIFRIYDSNAKLLWDNSVDETDELTYTPYEKWTSSSKPLDDAATIDDTADERIAHADFMTSRLIYHDAGQDDAILSIVNRRTGVEVVRVNLVDMLSRLRTSADIYRYTPQEFLDRGYEYQLTFFLRGDTWAYVNIEIAVLSWAMRIQYEHLEF